jgi:hypothetical protein
LPHLFLPYQYAKTWTKRKVCNKDWRIVWKRPGHPEGCPGPGHGYRYSDRGLAAIRATVARNSLEDLDLFAVFAFDHVPKVVIAAVAATGTLQAGVVGFDGVVKVGGWVPGWARIGAVHSVTPLSVGRVPGVSGSAGPFPLHP